MDLIIDAKWVVPVEPAGLLDEHSLVVEGGRILTLLPTREVAGRFQPRQRVALLDHALIPGLVNAHTHAAMTLLRGVADDLPLMTWLTEHIWPREARHVSPEFVGDGALLAAAEMLRGGVTCCNDMYFYPDATARALRRAGMRAMIGLPVLEFPTAYAPDAEGCLQRALAVRDELREDPLLAFSFAPHAPYTVSDASFGRIVTFAEELELRIQTHLHETQGELADSRREFGATPAQRLARLGVLGPGFIAIHAVHVGEEDAELLAAHRVHVVHCPTSNLKLASGIADVPGLSARGINLALGTDGAASNNRLDMFAELRLAALLGKVRSGDAAAVPAEKALRMATLGGAQALGIDAEAGSLEPGKSADVVAVNLGSLELSPCFDARSHLAYVAGRRDVSDVWVAGEHVVASGRLSRLDHRELLGKARYWQERLK